MFKILKEKIKNKSLILFGETHGTKEIPELLSQFFTEIAKEEDFNICLEIPGEFQENIEDFFKIKNDSRNSLEYFELIKNIKKLNKKYNRQIKIFCIDINSNFKIENEKNIQNKREEIMAENIMKILGNNKKTFSILGNIHASKKIILISKTRIVPTGFILFNKLKNRMFNVNISPKSGTFFNMGLKDIPKNDFKDSFNKGFDYIFEIKETNPCSFL